MEHIIIVKVKGDEQESQKALLAMQWALDQVASESDATVELAACEEVN